MKKILLRSLVSFSLLLFVYSCGTNPITGRSQVSTVSNAEIFPQTFAAYDQVMQSSKLSTNQAQTEQIKRVGVRIQKAVEKALAEIGKSDAIEGYQWEYNLIEDNQLNAWCMPGGKVAFYTGILPVCKDDNGIAVVMGHEIAHAIANHGAERISQEMIRNGVGQLGAQVLSGQVSPQTNQVIMSVYGVGTNLGMLKYSRTHESEADEMGIIFMALAGYNPNEAPAFWERMSAVSSSGDTPEFFSTHPHSTTRIQDLNKLLAVADEVYKTKSIQPYLDYKKKK